LIVAGDVWGKHPDELDGLPYHPRMMYDFIALKLIEHEESNVQHS